MVDVIAIISLLYGARTFRKVGTKPYRRKDGTDTTLVIWQSACVICGAPFEVSAPAQAETTDQSRSFTIVTCPAHRLTAKERTKLRYAKRHDRPALFEAIAAGKR
jgi:hypothetical protein